MSYIFDATPLIYLGKVRLLRLLPQIPRKKVLPTSVKEEVVIQGNERGKAEANLVKELLEKNELIERKSTRKISKKITKVAAKRQDPLHRAEADVLALAKEMDSIGILDDHVARNVGDLLGITVHGTGYFLGKFYVEGILEKSVLIKKIKEMRDKGWYLAGDDLLRIIQYLRELDKKP